MSPILPQGSRRTALALALGLFGLALAARLAFLAWAPARPTTDARFYHMFARALAAGRGYVDVDGSPAVLWMPGWPAALSLLYRAFGPDPRVGMALVCVLGAATTAMVSALGARWFGLRVAALAGLIHALWPGLIYYGATLMTETPFTCAVTAALLACAVAVDARRAYAPATAAGLALGLAAWIRSEALALAWVLALAFLLVRRIGAGRSDGSAVGGARGAAAIVALLPLLCVLPWGLRNQAAFGSFVFTSANAGYVLYGANHPLSSGTHSVPAERELERITGARGPSRGARILETNRVGLREGIRGIAREPLAFAARGARKLAYTYRSDSFATTVIRGFNGAGPKAGRRQRGVPGGGWIPETTRLGLARAADAYWWGVLALAALGGLSWRGWPAAPRVFALAWLGCFGALHFTMVAGDRFHQPETPLLALAAGVGAERLLAFARIRTRSAGRNGAA